jgi:L-fuconolactonase
MIIDSHQHFWTHDANYEWMMNHRRKDFLPNNLQPILQANKVNGCIAIQADQSEKENDFLLECAKQNQFVKGVVGWVDLTKEDVEDRLMHYANNPLFKGVRHIAQDEQDDWLLRDDVQRGISKLARYNLTFDILVYPHQLPAAIKMVAKFPKQRFILDHMAKPSGPLYSNQKWLQHIQELSKLPNVSCKLSGIQNLVFETNGYHFEDDDFTPFLDIIFVSFGADRLLFGSDWPVCLLATNYGRWLSIVRGYLNQYDKETRAKVLGGNAVRIYNLGG